MYSIYKITNNINGKFLYGRNTSGNSIRKKYSSNKFLKKEIIEFGAKNFSMDIIEELSSLEELNKKIKEYKIKYSIDPLSYHYSYKLSEEKRNNIKIGKENRINEKFNFKGRIKIKDRYFYEISDYCSHGNFIIRKTLFKKIYNLNGEFCPICRKEIKSNNLLDKTDIGKLLYPKQFEEKYISSYFPSLYQSILEIPFGEFQEKTFAFKNDIFKRPKCLECSNEVDFCKSKGKYNLYCNYHVNLHRISVGEIELYNWIKELLPEKDIIRNYRINNTEIDVFIPELKIGFEFNGLYWHSEIFKDRKYHYDKKIFFKDNGIDLFYIWEDDWSFKKDIIKSIIKNKLVKNQKIYARKTIIRELKSKDVLDFLNNNHLQGKIYGSVNLGLFFNGDLVSVMNFSKNRGNSVGWELLRFCNKLNLSVIGGPQRLLKYFIDHFHPEKIISYSDTDIFSGDIYQNLGFKKIGQTGPGFWWSDNHHKYNRRNFQKWKISENSNKTGDEIMKERGFYKIWNSGNIKWEYLFM